MGCKNWDCQQCAEVAWSTAPGLTHMDMDTANVISLWGQAGTCQWHLHSGLQSHDQIQISIVSHVIRGKLTEFPVGFIFAEGIGESCPDPCNTARAITPCKRDQMSPEIEVAILLNTKILIIGIPGQTWGNYFQVRNILILNFYWGLKRIPKIAYNILKL